MTEVAKLDDTRLEKLIANSETERVCARLELVDGHPRTALGLAAGLVVVRLPGCATTVAPRREGGGAIAGRITASEGQPHQDVLIVLEGAALASPLEDLSNHQGAYGFTNLPPGNYAIRALGWGTEVSVNLRLEEDHRTQVNFALISNSDYEVQVIMGDVVIDVSSRA